MAVVNLKLNKMAALTSVSLTSSIIHLTFSDNSFKLFYKPTLKYPSASPHNNFLLSLILSSHTRSISNYSSPLKTFQRFSTPGPSSITESINFKTYFNS